MSDEPILSTVVHEDQESLEQIRLTVNEFRGKQYMHVRRYYMDYEGDYKPTKDGIAIPITINNIVNMFDGLVELLAHSDVLHIILNNTNSEVIKKIVETIIEEKI